MHRSTIFTSDIEIIVTDQHLEARLDSGIKVAISAPGLIDTSNEHEVLGWAAMAAFPCASKQVERHMPEEVQQATRVLAQWVLDGCPAWRMVK